MAKKNFNDGLEDIFIRAAKERDMEVLMTESTTRRSKKPSGSADTDVKTAKKKSYRKSFTFDLNNLLDEAIAESKLSTAAMEAEAKEEVNTPKKRIKKIPLTGINALIRRTIDGAEYERDFKRDTKRVTFICDRDKIARLKKIAKAEKTYLKDIFEELIDRYIKKFELDTK